MGSVGQAAGPSLPPCVLVSSLAFSGVLIRTQEAVCQLVRGVGFPCKQSVSPTHSSLLHCEKADATRAGTIPRAVQTLLVHVAAGKP